MLQRGLPGCWDLAFLPFPSFLYIQSTREFNSRLTYLLHFWDPTPLHIPQHTLVLRLTYTMYRAHPSVKLATTSMESPFASEFAPGYWDLAFSFGRFRLPLVRKAPAPLQ